MTDDSSDQGRKVGCKLPPIHSRFQNGPSGNPRGRLKGVRNFAADIKRSLEIPVTLNDKGRGKRVSTQEALVLRLREKALKGDNRALETLLGLADPHNNPATRRRQAAMTISLNPLRSTRKSAQTDARLMRLLWLTVRSTISNALQWTWRDSAPISRASNAARKFGLLSHAEWQPCAQYEAISMSNRCLV